MRLAAANHLVVSRRNLLSLLAKLDGRPPDSACTLIGGDEAPGFVLTAEPDHVHYANRPPGIIHWDTKRATRGRS